jgi:hypothetical protein
MQKKKPAKTPERPLNEINLEERSIMEEYVINLLEGFDS